MSDTVKLKLKSKNIKAVIADQIGNNESFTELPQVLEREKQEHAHKAKLENEYNRGFEAGKEEASKMLEEKHAQELLEQSKDFYNIIASFEEKFKSFENGFHKLVINISQKIAGKIIKREMRNESVIVKVLEDNLHKIIGANEIVIKLNPADFTLIQKSGKENLASAGISKIRFEPNENINIGGCLVESEIGNLDARIESQLNEILKELEQKMINLETE